MKTFLFLLMTLSTLFGGTTVEKLRFESGISFYGRVGFVDMVFEQNTQQKTYKMAIDAHSTGIVNVLSQNRHDKFISEGNIVDGIYKPSVFTQITTKNGYKKVTRYSFDYPNNIVIKREEEVRHFISKSFDAKSFSFKDVPQTTRKVKTEELPLVANDYLSLYLNVEHKNIGKGELAYIDQNEEDKLILVGDGMFEVHKENGEEIYRVILKKDKNSIFFKEAISLDVAFYGDAYIRKVWEVKG